MGSLDFDTAVEQLRCPATLCEGAQALAELGQRRALVPLLRAYERPAEMSKVCLLDAMKVLGARDGAHELFDAGDSEQRRLAVHLMELFADDDHLERLERAAADSDVGVRAQALRAVACQRQTPLWESAMLRLLDSPDVDARRQAIRSLTGRRSDVVRRALERHGA